MRKAEKESAEKEKVGGIISVIEGYLERDCRRGVSHSEGNGVYYTSEKDNIIRTREIVGQAEGSAGSVCSLIIDQGWMSLVIDGYVERQCDRGV